MNAQTKTGRTKQTIALNKKARHDYFIDDVIEAGVALTGTEVKSLRNGRASIQESYASAEKGEIWLINSHIPEYSPANKFDSHQPRRHRKLLLHRREVDRLTGMVQREGATLIPLELYFNPRGIAKLALGIARGKKQHDKRETEKARDWQRQKQRLLREKG